MSANVLTVVINRVPYGPCRGYLLGLQSATEGAGEDARWLLPQVYGPDRRHAQHEVAIQVVLVVRMLRRGASRRVLSRSQRSRGLTVARPRPPLRREATRRARLDQRLEVILAFRGSGEG